MREIKFRAWDKTLKRMDYNFLRDFTDTMENSIGVEILPIQFIGLRDKNGKEIYEEDIVRVFAGSKSERIDSIVWGEYQAGFSLQEAPSGSLFGGDQIEIISNIY